MFVIARKPSEDPAQESLRGHKDQWNRTVSDFIDRTRDTRSAARLIALKRALNGHPVPELGLTEKGSIKEPLPPIITQMLDTLASEYQALSQDFQHILTDAKEIVQQQANYSETRRKPITPEQRAQIQQQRMMEIQQIEQQQMQEQAPVVASSNYNLVKESSNQLTRLWSYIKTPFMFGDEDRFARKNMLKTAAELQKRLLEIGNAILSKEPNSIPQAVLSSKDIIHLYEAGISEPLIALNLAKAEQASQQKEQGEETIPERRQQQRVHYTAVKTIKLNTDIFNQYLKGRVSEEVNDFNKYMKKYPQVVGVVLGQKPDGTWEAINIETREEAIEENKEEEKWPTEQVAEQVEESQPTKPVEVPPVEAPVVDLSGDGEVDFIDQIAGLQDDFNQKYDQIESWIIPTFNAARRDGTLPRGGITFIDNVISAVKRESIDLQDAIDSHDNPETIKSHYDEFNRLFNLLIETAAQSTAFQSQAFVGTNIEKFAQARLSRWFRRQWTSILKNRDYQLRLMADKVVTAADNSLDQLMNLLQQKNAPIDEVTKATIVFVTHLGDLLRHIIRLADNHNNQTRLAYYQARSRGDRSIMNFIQKTDLTDIKKMIDKLSELKRFVQKQKGEDE